MARRSRHAEADLLERLAVAFRALPGEREQAQALRSKILARAIAPTTALLQTVRGEDLEWRRPWPGIWMKVLKRDSARNLQLALLRLEPGATMPAHGHAREEECIVIAGELVIGTLCLRAGDLHIAAAGSRHATITSATGALVFVRSEVLTAA